MLTYNTSNLAYHGITTVEVDEVLHDPQTIWLDLGVSRDGNDRLMFVGLTRAHIFHAMDAGKRYLKEFNDAQ